VKSPSASAPSTADKQSLPARLFWFAAGGGFSVLLNLGPFHWLTSSAGLSRPAALALSLSFVTLLFGFWNYKVNFRTLRNWRDCIPRYLAALGFCSLLTYGISLAGIHQLGLDSPWDRALIGATQVGVSGIKFLLYHLWVYPRA
jgi:hypothetical protein